VHPHYKTVIMMTLGTNNISIKGTTLKYSSWLFNGSMEHLMC